MPSVKFWKSKSSSDTNMTSVPRLTSTSSSDSSCKGNKRSSDRSILRGAALVRETILNGNSDLSLSQFTSSTKSSSPNDHEWEDPWLHPSPSTLSRTSTVSRAYGDFSVLTQDAEDHWANVALKPRITERRQTLLRPQPSRRDDLPSDEEEHWASLALKSRRDTTERQPASLMDWEEVEEACAAGRESPLGWSSLDSSTNRGKASPLDWGSIASDSSQSAAPPPPLHLPPSYSSSSNASCGTNGTPITTMGRGKSLRLKVYTYHVQPAEDIGDESTIRSYLDAAPATPEFTKHFQDPAYQHAQTAGYLWQTLVGQHVKFPSRWWNGARSPRMGVEPVLDFGGQRVAPKWEYISCDRVPTNPILTRLVKDRSCAGRLLLHIIVKDLMTWIPVQDICIGMFHPNARGVRTTESPRRQDDWSRDVWMATRRRTDQDGTVMDAVFSCRQYLESPIGRKVNNQNMRAVFGETPPVHTIFLLESELYERMRTLTDLDQGKTPVSLLFLQEFMKTL
jgi:hypothetical protein